MGPAEMTLSPCFHKTMESPENEIGKAELHISSIRSMSFRRKPFGRRTFWSTNYQKRLVEQSTVGVMTDRTCAEQTLCLPNVC